MKTELVPVFEALRALYSPYAEKCVILHNDKSRYYLGTHETREKDGYRTGFGGVEIKKAYVSAHLMPVYIHPNMLKDVSVKLGNRMQGKSCFNFNKCDKHLFDELSDLIDEGVSRFELDGRL
jgi:hypothetical protein